MPQNALKYIPSLNNRLEGFNRISLDEMNKAKLMNRIDNKFIFSLPQLLELLQPLSEKYSILEINHTVNQSYTSFYYDTAYYDMYLNHHNKRVNRYKIRQRLYNASGDSFLEIKFKNNKGVTQKKRIPTEGEFKKIPYQCFDFINENTEYNAMMLQRVLENSFHRITLTNEKRNQRITIDTDLSYWLKEKPLAIPNLVIAEVKSTKNDIDKDIYNLFKERNILPTSMSKYSIGLAMLNPDIKHNLFKQKIKLINKLSHAC